GQDLLGLARWLRRAKQTDSAAALYRRAIQAGMYDHEMFQALWEQALVERKRGDHEAKAVILEDLAGSPNAFRAAACEELAKHHERVTKDFARALELTVQALALAPNEGLERRRARLEKRLGRQGPSLALYQECEIVAKAAEPRQDQSATSPCPQRRDFTVR